MGSRGPLSEPDPKSEIEMSLRESPFDDLPDFFTEPSSKFFDFRRLPLGGISWEEGDSPPGFDPRRFRRWREPPVEESWFEVSEAVSEDRWLRRVPFGLGALFSASMDWLLRDLGTALWRDFEFFELFSRSPEFQPIRNQINKL